ncbi:TfoX C-terminal domain-containing protein [Shewanella psychrophila]|uniref:TfoX C-terminal domain-containing protein n=1 Tax=Shewanella psychrophila TaxID=225848 RepID=A0A1S6HU46_9GAMM|nr:TfoX/Sxy family DNA transformation protein [Shewanella psychrophila]AQS38938.1 TfoX C-terminal domain-containing protein [Shewanella psychrophila]
MNVDKLPGLGPKSTLWLNKIDIVTKDDLEKVGPVLTMIRLEREGFNPGLNMLYALVGAVEGIHWQEVARSRKAELVLALDSARELDKLS